MKDVAITLAAIFSIVFALVFMFEAGRKTEAASRALTTTLTRDANHDAIQQATASTLQDGSALAGIITTAARSTTTATITTSPAHGYAVGQVVTVALLTGPTGFAALNGTYVITTVGSTTTFSYTTTTSGTVSSGAATGSATANQLSPVPTGTSEQLFTFPPGSFALVIIPTDATDATFSYTSGGGIGGTFPLYQNVSNVISGIEGDRVYIQRTTTTKLAFQFACGR